MFDKQGLFMRKRPRSWWHVWRPLSAPKTKLPLILSLALFLFTPSLALGQDAQTTRFGSDLDVFWIVLSAILVLFMQAGFLAFEVGLVRRKNAVVTAFKNLGDWTVVSVLFFFVGFAVMFGASAGGLIGWPPLMPLLESSVDPWFFAFVLFQLVFAGTGATIVSGAMAERTTFTGYLVISCLFALLIYPVYGHWVWGSALSGGEPGWLESLGFIDFAGSAVVHGTGAWAAFAGIKIVGPRLGRYDRNGNRLSLGTNALHWSVLGTILLWLGWFGFNGGSTLAFNTDTMSVLVNTNVAAASAGMAGFIHAVGFQRSRDVPEKVLGSILGGLVAITACAHIVPLESALLIGIVAGWVHNATYELVLDHWKLDDVVGALPVHGFCGIWGLVAVAIFGVNLPNDRSVQALIQLLGAGVNFVWAGGTAFVVFYVLRKLGWLRVSGRKEIGGLELLRGNDERTAEDAEAAELFDMLEDEIPASNGDDRGSSLSRGGWQ
jgi:Amt family ammonium transporter